MGARRAGPGGQSLSPARLRRPKRGIVAKSALWRADRRGAGMRAACARTVGVASSSAEERRKLAEKSYELAGAHRLPGYFMVQRRYHGAAEHRAAMLVPLAKGFRFQGDTPDAPRTIMRILQLVLAPRLSGAEVLAKGIAIGHQRSGHAVCIASLLPPHSDFAYIAGELRAQGVTCLFPARRYPRLGRLLF